MLRSSALALGGFIGAVSLSFSVATPVAMAWTGDEQSYIDQVQGGGVVGDPAKIVAAGHLVCDNTAQGAPNEDMANALAQGSTNINGPQAITYDQAMGMVITAQRTICPTPQPIRTDQNSAPDCIGLREAYDSVGPVATLADAVAKIKRKIGVSHLEGGALLACGIMAGASNTPDAGDQQFTGVCSGINNIVNPGPVNPCGTSPADTLSPDNVGRVAGQAFCSTEGSPIGVPLGGVLCIPTWLNQGH